VAAAHLVVRDHSANHPHLGSAWAAVCGEQLLGLLAQELNELGVPPVGKPPIRAQGIRRAQKSTVQQLAATGLCPNATLHHLAGVNRRTVIAWLSEPSPRPASVSQSSDVFQMFAFCNSSQLGKDSCTPNMSPVRR